MTSKHRLIVVGNGMAGARFVEDLVIRGGRERFDIVVFGDEPHGNYNRILLSGVLAGTHQSGDIMINPVSWYASNGIDLRAGVRIDHLDRATNHVVCADGARERYDLLVLATGSRPLLPPIDNLHNADGTLKDGAFVFRTIEDCDRILARARDAQTAVVIGGGLLGLEAARGLRNHGLDVHVVHLTAHVMDAQLDGPGSQILQRQLEGMGLQLQTARMTAALLGRHHVTGVRFANGESFSCDMVVIAAGIRPNTQLAEGAGLVVERGIVIGDDLACAGCEHIFAIGECTEHRGRVYGLVAPLWEQARVLADRLTGRATDAVYPGSSVSTKLKIAGLDVAVMGVKEPADEDDEVVSYSEPSRGIYKKLIVRNNRLVGAILIGDGPVVPAVAQAFLHDAPLAERRSEILFPIEKDLPPRNADDISDDAQICDCNAVSKARIVDAVLRGASSLQSVCEQTRAGTGCGSCRQEVQRIVDFTRRSLDQSTPIESGDAPPDAHANA
jgi:nitrite reductase (NADH) large subunit